MSSIIRRTFVVATGIAALGAASLAGAAGITGDAIEKLRNRAEERAQSEPQRAPQPRRRRRGRNLRQYRRSVRQHPHRRNHARTSATSRLAAFRARPRAGTSRPGTGQSRQLGNRDGNREATAIRVARHRSQPRPRSGWWQLSRNLRGNDPGRGSDGRGDNRGDRDDRNGTWRGDYRAPRVVQRLPRGYRNYNWNGRPYYHLRWQLVSPVRQQLPLDRCALWVVRVALPGYSQQLLVSAARATTTPTTPTICTNPHVAAMWSRRSPYDDERDDDYADDGALDEELYIYPARGQSEQQQADDRYECHRWAVGETDYDPIDDEYRAASCVRNTAGDDGLPHRPRLQRALDQRDVRVSATQALVSSR